MTKRHKVLLYTIDDVSDYARECARSLGAQDQLELMSRTHEVFSSPTAEELDGVEAVLGEFMPVRDAEVDVMADAGVRLVASMSIGINHVDVAGLAARGVAVSNDGSCLAVAGFSVSEAKLSGVLRFLNTSSEQPTAELLLPDELILDIGRMGNTLFVLSDCALRTYELKSGQLKSEVGFDGQHLLHYTLSADEGAVLVLGRYTVGQGSTLLHYGEDGELLGSAVLERDVQALAAGHDRLLALFGDGVALYDKSANLLQEQQIASVRGGVLLQGGVAALVDGSGVELLS